MAGVDPISLAVIGATVGAVASPNDPLKGALLGGTAGFTGGSALAASGGAAAAGASAIPTATGTAAQSLIPAASANAGLKSVLMAEGIVPAASQVAATPFTSALAGGASAAGMTGMDAVRMAGRGMQMAQSQQTPPPTVGRAAFRGGKEVTTTEPIMSLLATAQPRRRQPMSLL